MTALTLPPPAVTAPGQPADRTRLGKSRRVQFDLPPRCVARRNTRKRKTEATADAEVVKNALRLCEALIEETESGGKFLIRDAAGMVSPCRLFL
jgi:hypothetical protein